MADRYALLFIYRNLRFRFNETLRRMRVFAMQKARLFDYVNPAFGSFDMAHLDSGQGIIKLLGYRTHLFHTAGQADFPAVIHNLSNRRDNGCSSAETAFRKIFDFIKGNRTLLCL